MKLTKEQIKKLERARKYSDKSIKLMCEFVNEIENKLNVSSLEEVSCNGHGSDNLLEVICCHVAYNEEDIETIIKAIEQFDKEREVKE